MLAVAQACGALSSCSADRRVGPEWLRAYLLTWRCRPLQAFKRTSNRKLYSSASLAGMFAAAGEPLDGLIECIYGSDSHFWRGVWHDIEGRRELLRENPARVAGAASNLRGDARCRLLADIATFKLG